MKSVVSIEDRIPKLKQERKKRANRRLLLLLLLFFLFLCTLLYFQSPWSKIQTISIEGEQFLSKDEIASASQLVNEMSMWEVDEEAIEKRITDTLTPIQSVQVTRDWPQTIQISVEEYARMAYVRREQTFFPILENGDVLEDAQTNLPVQAPILYGFEGQETFRAFLAQLKTLPSAIVHSISEVYLTPKDTDPYYLTLFMNDGFEVQGTIRSIGEKMQYYPSIVSQLDPEAKGVIDLEVGSFFRTYELEGNTEEADEQTEEGDAESDT
ncbi:cell division protein FtsQ/DivIB [Bacillus fonticola]|uniref:cell division protein FtsQ/DivIB n=1 Tax=Bacillus fonticola TaxID=2728853 RepID=UPI001D146DAD|nr:FtsQ-type POTRA domain-containing protein [Bacillus fonticola]